MVEASSVKGDRLAGVAWHTLGSGKSLSMVFYAGKLIRDLRMENPTIVVLTDRIDLDGQLFNTFSQCDALLRQTRARGCLQAELTGAHPVQKKDRMGPPSSLKSRTIMGGIR